MNKYIKPDNSDFTPEGYELIEKIYQEMMEKSKYVEVDDETLKEAVRELYRLGGLEPVDVEVLESPIHINERTKELYGQEEQPSWYGNISDFGWLGTLKMGIESGILEKEGEEYNDFVRAFKAIVDSGIWHIVTMNDRAFTCRRPKTLLLDENDELHSMTEPAVVFYGEKREVGKNYGAYFIHGKHFTKSDFEKAIKATPSEILNWSDIEQRSALLEEKGSRFLLDECGAQLIDSTEEMGGYELYEVDLKDLGKTKILHFKSWSTEDKYAHIVPPESTNALDTASAMHNLSTEDFLQSVHS
jgi:hypothetical protein